MPKYVLTGFGGHLGMVAADHAAATARPDQSLVFTNYTLADNAVAPADKVAGWRARGIEVLEATYDDIESLRRAFAGAEAVAFISTWAFGRRAEQAANVLRAAKECGVRRVVYCGAAMDVSWPDEALFRDVRSLPFLLQDHVAIERLVMSSGMQWQIQRNTLYQDNIPALFAQSWKFCGNKWLNNSGGKKNVAREDCARVWASLLLGHAEPNTYHLVTGPEAVTDREVFDYMTEKTGYRAEYVEMSDDELATWWRSRGLPDDFATGDFSKLPMKLCIPDLVCCGQLAARGYMGRPTDTVERLTRRKPLSFKENYVKYESLFPKND